MGGGGRFSATLLLSHLNLVSFLNSFNILFLLANEQYGLKIFEHVCPPLFPYSHAFPSFFTSSTFLQFEILMRERRLSFSLGFVWLRDGKVEDRRDLIFSYVCLVGDEKLIYLIEKKNKMIENIV